MKQNTVNRSRHFWNKFAGTFLLHLASCCNVENILTEENMKTKHSLFVLFIFLGGLILSACGGAAATDIYQGGAAATGAPALAEEFAAQAPAQSDVAKRDVSSVAAPHYNIGDSPDAAAF